MWTQNVGAWTPSPQKIQSPDHVEKKKIMETFDLKFGMTKKFGTQTPTLPEKFKVQSSWCMKKFRKIFYLKFGMTKKVDALTHPQWRKIQSPEGSVKKIILKKKFDLIFGMNKKVGAQVDAWTPTPTWQIQSPEHSVNKKNFLRPPSENFRAQRFL